MLYVYIYIYTQCNGESYVIEIQSILNHTYTHNHQESISFYSFLCVSSFFQETFGLGTHGLQRPPVPRQPLVPRDAAPADAPGAAEAVGAAGKRGDPRRGCPGTLFFPGKPVGNPEGNHGKHGFFHECMNIMKKKRGNADIGGLEQLRIGSLWVIWCYLAVCN